MYHGNRVINWRTEWVMRVAGLGFPLILLGYGLLVRAGLVGTAHYGGDLAFGIIIGIWLLVGIFQFFVTPQNPIDVLIRLVIYHVLAGAYVIFIAGFAAPFVVAWVLLIISSYAYFAGMGLFLSASLLVLVGIIEAITAQRNLMALTSDIIAVCATLTVGFTVAAISKSHEIDNTELARTKALETLQRDRILTLVNNLADAILSTDKDGVIKVYNAACLNLLDTNSSLDGKPIQEVLKLHSSDNTELNLLHELKSARGVVVRDDIRMLLEDETVRLEVTYSPIRSSYSGTKKATSSDGYIIILRDITKAKSLEEERDEFISVVSHELRTPITIAEGTISNVQVLLDRPKTPPETLKAGVDTAHDQVMFLAKMVNDLSTLSRAERGVADQPEEIEVLHLIDDLYNEYAPQAEKKGLHFNLDLSSRLGQVTASKLYLKEMLQNFITNSLKYTKEGSITLKVVRHDKKLLFDVKDTGIGISKSDQTKVFGKFYRSEDYRTRETGGTGLGLYVSAKLAKKLNTDIKLVSRLNHGSSFSFELPASDTATNDLEA